MISKNIIELSKKLQKLGFGNAVAQLNDYRQTRLPAFTIYSSRQMKRNDDLMFALEFKRNEKQVFELREYELTMRHIPIPDLTINGINTTELEGRMKKADELYNQYLAGNEDSSRNYIIESANRDLDILFQSEDAGKEIAQLFAFKYWPETEYRKYISNDAMLKQKYESSLTVSAADGNILTAKQAYEKLKTMKREHVISDELLEAAHMCFAKGETWVAYNTIPYFLDKGDMYFFKTSDEVHEFSNNNISEYDNYRVLHAYSTDELLKRISYGEAMEQQLDNLKTVSIMNEQNFDYLKDNIKYLGFGEKQHDELETHLKEGKEAFQMTYSTEINKKPFEAVLQFRKSENSEMYFLNSYKASLEWSNGEKKEQTFYLNYGRGVTAKEAFNLMSGRSVEKELMRKLNPEETAQFKAELKLSPEQRGLPENWEKSPTYKAWIQLDFENKDKNNNYEVKQYHENYGYDLKAAVGKYFVMEMDGGEKEKALLQSLQKGNIQSVNINVDGNTQKMFIEANPQYKTINLYDDKMQRLNQEQRLNVSQKQSGKELKEVKEDQKQEIKQDIKKSVKQKPADDLGGQKKGRSRKKGMSA